MKRKTTYICSVCLCLAMAAPAIAQDADPQAYSAKIVEMRSASSYRVDAGDGPRTLFLFGATAPNAKTAEGARALAQAELFALDRQVKVIVRDDSGAVPYADILLPGGRNLAHELVRNGWARWDRVRAANDTALEALESIAKEDGAGMWSANPADAPIIESLDQTETSRAPSGPVEIGITDESPTLRRGDAKRDRFGTIHLQSKGRMSTSYIIDQKNQLRAQQAAEAAARAAALEEQRIAQQQALEQQRLAQEAAQREAMAQQREQLELEREQLRNELLYRQLNPNTNQVYVVNNGGYYYTNPNPYYNQPFITITPRQPVEEPVEQDAAPQE